MLAVAIVAQNEDGDVLLRQRTKEPDNGTWQLVAGYVNQDETVIQSVKRLLKEKTNITNILDITFTGRYYDAIDRHPGQRCVPLLFKVLVSNSEMKNIKNSSWFNREDMQKMTFALDNGQMLKDEGLL
jgi:ADP-ribose pyrophosphatase YjhB (NUDIX family)